jgi:hypothetical protein
LAALALVVLTAACGDDDAADTGDGDAAATTAASTTAATTTTVATVALPAGCERVPYTVDLRVDGEGSLETFDVVDAIAARTAGGRAFTVYLADFVMDRDDRSYSFVTDPPPGGTVVQTGLTVFNAPDLESVPVLAGGETGQVKWEAGQLATFLNITAEDAPSFSVDMTGSAQLLHVDDGTVCIEADITSESGFALRGVYTAEITADF